MTETASITEDQSDEERINETIEKLPNVPSQQYYALEINSAYVEGIDILEALNTTENSHFQEMANNMRKEAVYRAQSLHDQGKENVYVQESLEDITFRIDNSQDYIADLTHGTSVTYDKDNDLYTAMDYIYIVTSEWDPNQSLDEAKATAAHHKLKIAVQTEYSVTDNLNVSSILFVGTIGADDVQATEMYVDIDGKWTVMDNLKQSQVARQLSEKMGYKDHVKANLDELENKRQQHTLPISDSEHDQFIESLQNTYGDRYTQKEIESIVEQTFPEAVSNQILENQLLDDKNYRLIANVFVTQGTNSIFTGDNPRDFANWISYDKHTGIMTRLFEEDKDIKETDPDAWMESAGVEKA